MPERCWHQRAESDAPTWHSASSGLRELARAARTGIRARRCTVDRKQRAFGRLLTRPMHTRAQHGQRAMKRGRDRFSGTSDAHSRVMYSRHPGYIVVYMSYMLTYFEYTVYISIHSYTFIYTLYMYVI